MLFRSREYKVKDGHVMVPARYVEHLAQHGFHYPAKA